MSITARASEIFSGHSFFHNFSTVGLLCKMLHVSYYHYSNTMPIWKRFWTVTHATWVEQVHCELGNKVLQNKNVFYFIPQAPSSANLCKTTWSSQFSASPMYGNYFHSSTKLRMQCTALCYNFCIFPHHSEGHEQQVTECSI